MDVSPKQIVSVSAALIPFLENDDANRALMGSTCSARRCRFSGLRRRLSARAWSGGRRDSGAIVSVKRDGIVEAVDSTRITVKGEDAKGRTVIDTTAHQVLPFEPEHLHEPETDRAHGRQGKKRQVIADGPRRTWENSPWARTCSWHSCLGAAITTRTRSSSARLVKEDRYTSIHIEEFEIEARDTKLGKEYNARHPGPWRGDLEKP